MDESLAQQCTTGELIVNAELKEAEPKQLLCAEAAAAGKPITLPKLFFGCW